MCTFDIRHLTEYHDLASVRFLPHRLFLRPREGHDAQNLFAEVEQAAFNPANLVAGKIQAVVAKRAAQR